MEALTREFEFIAQAVDAHETPARLLQLVESLRDRFGGLNVDTGRRVEAALADEASSHIDLVYRLPPRRSDAAEQARRNARRSRRLLPPRRPAHARGDRPSWSSFRRWFLGEIVGQLAGAAPTPWDVSP